MGLIMLVTAIRRFLDQTADIAPHGSRERDSGSVHAADTAKPRYAYARRDVNGTSVPPGRGTSLREPESKKGLQRGNPFLAPRSFPQGRKMIVGGAFPGG